MMFLVPCYSDRSRTGRNFRPVHFIRLFHGSVMFFPFMAINSLSLTIYT